MIWLLLLIVLIAIFGIGTVLEGAFWTLLIIALIVVALVFAASRTLRR